MKLYTFTGKRYFFFAASHHILFESEQMKLIGEWNCKHILNRNICYSILCIIFTESFEFEVPKIHQIHMIHWKRYTIETYLCFPFHYVEFYW